jgi:hypothetical protein
MFKRKSEPNINKGVKKHIIEKISKKIEAANSSSLATEREVYPI